MLVSEVLIVFNAVRHFPGEDIDGLAERIYERYGDMRAARFLIHGDMKYHMIPARINELRCIEERDGRYYFNPDVRPYSNDPILDSFIRNILETEAKSEGK